MNFKFFTSALLATAATAQAAGQTSALGDSLQAKYQDMPEHVQRRFWVRILSLLNYYKKLLTNFLASIGCKRCSCSCQPLPRLNQSRTLDCPKKKARKSFVILFFLEPTGRVYRVDLRCVDNKVDKSVVFLLFCVTEISLSLQSFGAKD